MITTRRRLAGALLIPLLAFAVAGCTDSDDETTTASDEPSNESDSGSETGAEAPAEAKAEFTFRPLDVGGPNTKAALESGDIDIAVLFSSDGAIAANDWVALEDDKDLQSADNFVPAIRTEASSPEIEAVLDAVSAELTVDDVQEMVAMVSIEGENPEDVAGAFLEDKELLGDLTAEGSINVGSADFAESSIAAQLYGQALEAAGVDVEYTPAIGARDVYYAALESGEVDLVPEFTGSLLLFLDPEATASADVEGVLESLRPLVEEDGITITEPAEADSVNTYVVTKDTADEFGLKTVSDLAGVDEELTLGGPPECPERAFCIPGLEETYGLKFAS